MADYVYRKVVHRNWYRRYRLRRRSVVIFILLMLIIGAVILVDSTNNKKPESVTSAIQNIQIADQINTFKSPYFSFQDSGKWVLNKQDSNAQKFVYYKFSGVQPQLNLTVYVNQTPISLYLASSRVLPVRIVNSNNLDVTNVYGPCGATYKADELHNIKIVNIQGANMLCDPDTPQYTVQLAEINGNYQLNMTRSNGEPIMFVITYRDQTLSPGPGSILRIANSFQAL